MSPFLRWYKLHLCPGSQSMFIDSIKLSELLGQGTHHSESSIALSTNDLPLVWYSATVLNTICYNFIQCERLQQEQLGICKHCGGWLSELGEQASKTQLESEPHGLNPHGVPQVIVLKSVFITRSISHIQVISLSFITTKCFPGNVKFITDFKFDKVPVGHFWFLHGSSLIQLILCACALFCFGGIVLFLFWPLSHSCQTRNQEIKAQFCWNTWQLNSILSFLHSASKWDLHLKNLERKYVEIPKSLKALLPIHFSPLTFPGQSCRPVDCDDHVHGWNKRDILPFYPIQIIHSLDAVNPRWAD